MSVVSKINNPGKVNLNSYLKYGNFHNPYMPIKRTAISTISANIFPSQDQSQIGSEYVLQYVNMKDSNVLNYEVFRVVRWDNEHPNVVILLNRYTGEVIVSSPDHVLKDDSELYDDRGRLISNQFIHQIGIQTSDKMDYPIAGIYCENEYWDSEQVSNGIILRCDAPVGETRVTVIYELEQKRYVLMDETRCMIKESDLFIDKPRIKDIMKDLDL